MTAITDMVDTEKHGDVAVLSFVVKVRDLSGKRAEGKSFRDWA